MKRTMNTIGAATLALVAVLALAGCPLPQDEAQMHKVAYVGNGATSGSVPMTNYFYEGEMVMVEARGDLARVGHAFAGWNTAPDGSGDAYAEYAWFSMPRRDVTLHAQWTPLAPHTLTYDANGGAGALPSGPASYYPGDAVTILGPGGLTRAGYLFNGWTTSPDGSGAWYQAGDVMGMPDADATLHAYWLAATTYSVTYYANGGAGAAPVDAGAYAAGSRVTVLGQGALSRPGYAFDGWNTASNGTGTSRAAGATFTMPAAAVALYAQWAALPTRTVAYVANGGSGSVPVDATAYWEGQSVTVLGQGSLLNAGYTFAGWNTEVDGTGTTYAPGATFAMPAAAVTLYARWTLSTTYRVFYDPNGGAGSAPVDSNYYLPGTTVTVLAHGAISRYGYSFAGWNTAADGSGTDYAVGSTFAMPSADRTLYAKWVPAPKYSVTYTSSFGTGDAPVDAATYFAGDAVTVLGQGTLERPGYSFAGWRLIHGGTTTDYLPGETFAMPAASVTLYANWDYIPTYGVIYYANGGAGTPPSDPTYYPAGQTVTVLGQGSLAQTGYLFDGWNTASNGTGTRYAPGDTFPMPGSNVQLFAMWKPLYRVIYNAYGGTGAPVDPNYYQPGATATVLAPGSMTRTDYIFKGWNTLWDGSGTAYAAGDALIMGAANVTLYAIWDPPLAVTYSLNGGTGVAPVDPVKYHAGDTATILGPGELSRPGYVFVGWNSNSTGTGTNYAPGQTVTMSASLQLYARWQVGYQVNYYGNYGSPAPVDPTYYLPGSKVTVLDPGAMVRPNYLFKHWNSAMNGSGTAYAPGDTITMPAGNLTLYAQWYPPLTITYEANSGSGTVPVDGAFYHVGDSATILGGEGLSYYGKVFIGWNQYPAGTGTDYAPGQVITVAGNMTMWAKWANAYTVTYSYDGYSGGSPPVDAAKYASGWTVTVLEPGTLTKAGSVFSGWNTTIDRTGTTYQPGETFPMPAANLTLYPIWTALPRYGVSYDGNGATGGTAPVDSGTYYEGQNLITKYKGTLVKDGYAFVAWNTLADGSGADVAQGVFYPMPASDLTLYAKWAPTYSVVYDGNGFTGGTVPTEPTRFQAGAAVTARTQGTMVRAGYLFAGWNTAADGSGEYRAAGASFTMPAAAVTLYAQWDPTSAISVAFSQPADETITLGPSRSVPKAGTLSVTVIESFDEFRWYLDGALVAGAADPFIAVSAAPLATGNHTLAALVRKGAAWYSKTLYFSVGY